MFLSINLIENLQKEEIFISKPRGLGYKHSHEDELSYALEALFQSQGRKSIFHQNLVESIW